MTLIWLECVKKLIINALNHTFLKHDRVKMFDSAFQMAYLDLQ